MLGGEHFFGHLPVLHCAAAPIRDVRGQLAAVLDVSSESRPFGFDAAAVVALYATTIENRLLRAQSTEHIVVRLQTSLSLLGTPMEGLAGLDSNGRIAWVNNVAARLLGVAQGDEGLRPNAVFGLDANRLSRLTHESGAVMHRLPNGLNIWLAAHMQSRDGAAHLHRLGHAKATNLEPNPEPEPKPEPQAEPARDAATAFPPAAAAPAGTLRDRDRHLISQTVQDCGGNVSKAARTLGVSRGLVYRHLKQATPATSD